MFAQFLLNVHLFWRCLSWSPVALLGTPDRTMISFVGKGHMMVYDADQVARMKHFATAFFGYYLQGRDDYAGYLEDFVAQHDDLAWGVYTDK
jgi:hypothetical protein